MRPRSARRGRHVRKARARTMALGTATKASSRSPRVLLQRRKPETRHGAPRNRCVPSRLPQTIHLLRGQSMPSVWQCRRLLRPLLVLARLLRSSSLKRKNPTLLMICLKTTTSLTLKTWKKRMSTTIHALSSTSRFLNETLCLDELAFDHLVLWTMRWHSYRTL